MLAPIGTFLSAINTSAIAVVVPAVLILGLILAGVTFMLGNHERAKTQTQWTLVGGAVAFMSTALATAVAAAVPH
jgi:hypothetical protein